MSRKLRNGLIGSAAGLAVAALLVPAVAGGNARPDPDVETALVAQLSGGAEFPGPGDSDGTGAASATIDLANLEICYDLAVAGILPATAAHIHRGAVGVAGPIVVDLTAPTAGSSSGCVIDPDVAEIAADPAGFYFNVHTSDFPAGAIRGQISVGPDSNNVYLLGEPLRNYDSRTAPAGKCQAGQTRTISLQTGRSASGAMTLAVPSGATAAQVTLTVTETENDGFLTIFSAALAVQPTTSNINWSETGQNLAVATNVAVDAQSEVKVFCFENTHFVLDTTGFYY
jgi:hypothetical protein